MNVRKRPRLELATAVTATAPTTSATSVGAALAVPHAGSGGGGGGSGGGGLFLTSSSIGSHLGAVDINNGAAQIYLTICGDDDNSNESQEFYAIESIKQEPGDLDALHALLPTNLQLPTGCEIYLVKDTVASTTAVAVTAASGAKMGDGQMTSLPLPPPPSSMAATIKLEPDSILTSTMPSTNVLHFVGGNGNGTTPTHSLLVAATNKSSPISAGASTIATAHPAASAAATSTPAAAASGQNAAPTASAAAAAVGGYNVKMDAYKKRDDKRRATHNEVERRRRDKINCWIFKLKEMLPTEGNRYAPLTNPSPNASAEPAVPDSKQANIRSSHNNGRTPPNDSKSQILIKACDYIKSMQNEIDR